MFAPNGTPSPVSSSPRVTAPPWPTFDSHHDRPTAALVGSRRVPASIADDQVVLGATLASHGWVLRSGAADGSDTNFLKNVPLTHQEVFIPWSGFSDVGPAAHVGIMKAAPAAIQQRATDLASAHHPGWARLSPAVRFLMMRNACQVLGADLATPVDVVICWAPKPRWNAHGALCDVDGGTGLAVRLAHSQGIPVLLMGHPAHDAVLSRLASGHTVDLQALRAPPSPLAASAATSSSRPSRWAPPRRP